MPNKLVDYGLVMRCGASLFLLAITYTIQVKPLEHGWAVLNAVTFGVEYSYTDSEDLYMNILRWDEPQKNYNRSLGVIIATRCTYFHIWAMCIPFFMKRGCLLAWSRIPSLIKAFVFVSIINLVRFMILYSAVKTDAPWWLAHDVPNAALTTIALGLSIAYFLRKGPENPCGIKTTISHEEVWTRSSLRTWVC